MKNTAKSTPKDVFLHLLGIATLIVSVVSFITLWFQYIDVRFPDALQYRGSGSYYLDSVRWAVAALVVVFPVYILVCWILGRDYKIDPSRREVRARKWLLYLTLFISAVTIIADLVTLIYNYLNGDLTVSFFLKILTVLIVSTGVFGYYIWDLRRDNFKSTKPKGIAWMAIIVVALTAGIAFYLVGTPATQRDRKFDERRISDLQMLQNEITNFWMTRRILPSSLSDLNSVSSYFNMPQDPQSGASYEYAVASNSENFSYTLCANFKLVSQNSPSTVKPAPVAYDSRVPSPYNDTWDHDMGRVCFTRSINSALYPTSSPLLLPPKLL